MSGCGAATQLAGGGDSKPQVGDTVLFKASAIAYNEGKVEKIEGSKYEIRSGSNIAKVDAADVYALPKSGAKADVKAGDIVAAFGNDVYWAGGEVKNVSSDLVEVEKASGGKLNVAHDKVIKVSPAATADIRQHIANKAFEDLGKTKKPVLPKDWKPKKGEKIAAQWSFGSWHTAIIKNVNANNIDIDWQNGWSDGTVATDKIAPVPSAANALPNVNDYVIVKPQSDNAEWKFATVTAINGQEAEVKFADGKTQKLKAGDFIALS
jgi:hypothetical protein